MFMSEIHPYQAPSASVEPAATVVDFQLHDPRAVQFGHGWSWIADGFRHFKRNPWAWIGACLLVFMVMLALAFIPVVNLISGLIFFVWVGGFMLGCKAQTDGEDFRVGHVFAGFSNNAVRLILLSVVSTVISLLVMGLTVGSVYYELITSAPGSAPPQIEDPAMLMSRVLIGMALLLPLFMALWFAPALIVINDIPTFRAMALSFKACLKNIVPFLLYGIVGLALYIVSIIPLGLGLLVFFPTMLATLYTSYKDVFIDG